jgi:hypothetical protein
LLFSFLLLDLWLGKRDITLRNYFEKWERLAVSGAPEGHR